MTWLVSASTLMAGAGAGCKFGADVIRVADCSSKAGALAVWPFPALAAAVTITGISAGERSVRAASCRKRSGTASAHTDAAGLRDHAAASSGSECHMRSTTVLQITA